MRSLSEFEMLDPHKVSAFTQMLVGRQILVAHRGRRGDASTLQSAKAYTDQKFGDVVSGGAFDEYKRAVDHRFNNLNDRLNKVGAMGAAMSQMAFSTQGANGENRLGVGVGGYKGQGALSVGYSRSITPNATVTFGAAISGGESSGGVGVGVGW